MMKRLILPIALMLLPLAACGGGGGQPTPQEVAQPDLVGVLGTRPSLKRFADALETTGVADRLQADGAYTIFAPMDKAVNGPLDEATIRHHILPIRVTFSDMAGESTSYDTLNDDQIEIDVTERIAIGTGLMVESDITATNGVIHVIDRVQTPTAEAATSLEQESPNPASDPIDGTASLAAPATGN